MHSSIQHTAINQEEPAEMGPLAARLRVSATILPVGQPATDVVASSWLPQPHQ